MSKPCKTVSLLPTSLLSFYKAFMKTSMIWLSVLQFPRTIFHHLSFPKHSMFLTFFFFLITIVPLPEMPDLHPNKLLLFLNYHLILRKC